MQEGLHIFPGNAEFRFTAAAVNEEADTGNHAAGSFDNIDDFLYGTACGNNIFNNENAFSRLNTETAAQGHFTVFAFRKNSTRAESFADFMGQENASRHGAHNGPDMFIFKACG